ncbi:MAG: VOC family protein [Cyanobacteria bacterium J06554_6]
MAVQPTAAFVTIASDRFDLLVSFYRAFLDQLPQSYVPQQYAEFSLPGLKLAIFLPKHAQEFEGAAGGMSVCLEVADLKSAIATLTQIGYPPPGDIIHASHGQEVYAYDPTGNRLILHQAK